jgi:hypothetical protein
MTGEMEQQGMTLEITRENQNNRYPLLCFGQRLFPIDGLLSHRARRGLYPHGFNEHSAEHDDKSLIINGI